MKLTASRNIQDSPASAMRGLAAALEANEQAAARAVTEARERTERQQDVMHDRASSRWLAKVRRAEQAGRLYALRQAKGQARPPLVGWTD